MGRRERMKARGLKEQIVPMPGRGGQPDEVFTVRALLPSQFDDLVAAHPPTDEERKKGAPWDIMTFRPALLYRCVVTPEGETELTEQDYVDAWTEGWINAGELMIMFNACVDVNDRSPMLLTKKD